MATRSSSSAVPKAVPAVPLLPTPSVAGPARSAWDDAPRSSSALPSGAAPTAVPAPEPLQRSMSMSALFEAQTAATAGAASARKVVPPPPPQGCFQFVGRQVESLTMAEVRLLHVAYEALAKHVLEQSK